MSAHDAFHAIVENIAALSDWEDRYRYLVKLGQALPKLTDAEKSEANKVYGCASQVWLTAQAGQEGGLTIVRFRGESDAMIVQGLVALLLALYSGRPAREVVETDAIHVFDQIGLREHLTRQRANGLAAMATRMRAAAKALC